MIAFGPVPSRRLGRSLGINNIPPKNCTYSCVYCQLGRTLRKQVIRRSYYPVDELFRSVKQKVSSLKNDYVDYLTFVPDGEPTLDINLGEEIEALRELNIDIAVISNSSLLWDKEVQKDLSKADLVSLKVDAVTENIWRRVNRPHKSLNLKEILSGVLEFSRDFKGDLLTETMLIRGINDSTEEIKRIADFIAQLEPKKSYVSSPFRPPAEERVKVASEYSLITAYQCFKDNSIDVEILTGHEEPDFGFTGDAESDLLSITSVHPMRKESLEELLIKSNESWELIERLIDEDKLAEVEYEGHKFYIRKFA
ncbi:MAG: radical SAM protein [Archaeoglobaceae archaeon]